MASEPTTGDPPNEVKPPSSSNRHVPIIIAVPIIVLLGLFGLWLYNDEHGTKITYHYVNGKADEEWVYNDGRLVEYLRDRNLDGAWDYWIHYDGNGQIADEEYDNNFDKKPDETWTYSNGLLMSVEKDTDFNDTPDEFSTYKYGVLQQVDFRPNGSKFVTQRWIYRNGVLAEILRGGDTNGNFKETLRYDPFSNPIGTNTN